MGFDFFPCVAARGYVEASVCTNQHIIQKVTTRFQLHFQEMLMMGQER